MVQPAPRRSCGCDCAEGDASYFSFLGGEGTGAHHGAGGEECKGVGVGETGNGRSKSDGPEGRPGEKSCAGGRVEAGETRIGVQGRGEGRRGRERRVGSGEVSEEGAEGRTEAEEGAPSHGIGAAVQVSERERVLVVAV